jgi:hypothetical protein
MTGSVYENNERSAFLRAPVAINRSVESGGRPQ